jgi:type II secretory pathway predicted ATPase ExeA
MGHIDRILANLREHFHVRRVLLIIDEAQHLDLDCLEVIRELLDQPPYFSLLLAGSHDLYTKFDAHSATLEQWNSRITEKVALPAARCSPAAGLALRQAVASRPGVRFVHPRLRLHGAGATG